ncbi:non-hydrolyzing UDP-N-acetylglucosamine 2-epimerase [Candidatus Margulisiibacteriota bacterium]
MGFNFGINGYKSAGIERIGIQKPARPIKLCFVAGTRPEIIKLAPVIQEAQRSSQYFSIDLILTGQHKGMTRGLLRAFGVDTKKVRCHNLNVMKHGQSWDKLHARLIKGTDGAVKAINPDMIIVQGDTETTNVAAYVSYRNRKPLAHVEAGLRTGDLNLPWPEEYLRRSTDVVTDLLFAPTRGARENLEKENLSSNNIYLTGNTVIDAVKYVESRYTLGNLPAAGQRVIRHLPKKKKIILLTCHRRESWGFRMKGIFDAVRTLALKNPDAYIVFPVHLNPVVQEIARATLRGIPNVQLTSPLDYPTMIHLIKKSHLIMTDSGGIQEEAAYLGKPVIIMREKTERPEAVEKGIAVLVGTHDSDRIIKETEKLLLDEERYKEVVGKMEKGSGVFGDGKASKRIINEIVRYFLGAKHHSNNYDSYEQDVAFIEKRPKRLPKSYRKAAGWLIDSGIQNRNGSFNGFFDTDRGNYPFAYPEITGYAASLLSEPQKFGDLETLQYAEKAAAWISGSLQNTGYGMAMPARVYSDPTTHSLRYSLSYGYDNGIIMSSFLNLYKATGDKKYISAAESIAGFLIGDLKWGTKRPFALYDPVLKKAMNRKENWSMSFGAYETNAALGFFGLYEYTKKQVYFDVAISVCEKALKQQRRSGRFVTSTADGSTHGHPHMYAANGLYRAALYLQLAGRHQTLAKRFIHSAARATKWMLDNQLPDGTIRYLYGNGEFMPFERSDALAQVVSLGSSLVSNGHLDIKYMQNLHSALHRLTRYQDRSRSRRKNGGFRFGVHETGASIDHINAWCTMFAIDALSEYAELIRKVGSDDHG